MFKVIDKNIRLDEESHIYSHSKYPKTDFTSVTSLLKPYFEPFNSMEIATDLCNNNYKYIGRKPEELIQEWNNSRDLGTEIHAQIEHYIRDNKKPTETKAKNAVKWLNKYGKSMDLQFLPEVIVYSTDLSVAGTIDLLSYDSFTDSYEIIDWKSNKKINKRSFGGKMGIDPITFDLEDCNYNHYALQLSLYRYLLEKYYDIVISNQKIVHLTEKRCNSIDTPYYKDHIIKIINNKQEI
jgi:ATP-dependent exoDNAse (exonuclease V) beta subunit